VVASNFSCSVVPIGFFIALLNTQNYKSKSCTYPYFWNKSTGKLGATFVLLSGSSRNIGCSCETPERDHCSQRVSRKSISISDVTVQQGVLVATAKTAAYRVQYPIETSHNNYSRGSQCRRIDSGDHGALRRIGTGRNMRPGQVALLRDQAFLEREEGPSLPSSGEIRIGLSSTPP
jgi:hypothetical protein